MTPHTSITNNILRVKADVSYVVDRLLYEVAPMDGSREGWVDTTGSDTNISIEHTQQWVKPFFNDYYMGRANNAMPHCTIHPPGVIMSFSSTDGYGKYTTYKVKVERKNTL